jgi:hypothetical protein
MIRQENRVIQIHLPHYSYGIDEGYTSIVHSVQMFASVVSHLEALVRFSRFGLQSDEADAVALALAS